MLHVRLPIRIALFALTLGLAAERASADFEFKDQPGDHLDVLLDGKIVARYMYAHDTSSQERHDETYKPYLHVYDTEGQGPITKGPGGLFTHHRGIFVGWMKIGFAGKTYDRWHMKGGDIIHRKFVDQLAGCDSATFTSMTEWMDEGDKPIIEESRSMTFRRAESPLRLIIDFATTIKAPRGEITLDGDPEHAGIQFRPANEVVGSETKYVYPRENANAHNDRDYPWVGESFTLAGKRYSVVQINQPENPEGTRWSAYRDYGRFGAFPVAKIPEGGSRTFRYEFLIADGEMLSAAAIQKLADAYTGASSASPTPAITVLPAEQSKPAAAKKAAPKKGAKQAKS
jgi:hypothetical protein